MSNVQSRSDGESSMTSSDQAKLRALGEMCLDSAMTAIRCKHAQDALTFIEAYWATRPRNLSMSGIYSGSDLLSEVEQGSGQPPG